MIIYKTINKFGTFIMIIGVNTFITFVIKCDQWPYCVGLSLNM